MTETIIDADAIDFALELVGHKIVSLTDETIILDDGTVLLMHGTADCCAYFDVVGTHAEDGIADNIITAVKTTDLDGYEYDEGFRLHILSEATELGYIDIDGTASSGYYCHSIDLEVRRA